MDAASRRAGGLFGGVFFFISLKITGKELEKWTERNISKGFCWVFSARL